MRNILEKFVGKSKRKYYEQHVFFETRAVCEIMWENMVEAGRQTANGDVVRRREDSICAPYN
jgi:hypothetical protein